MATWAIGDVHGCLEKLEGVWNLIAPTREDELVFLGDLIDRGPDSRGVVRFVMDRIGEGFNVTCLMGNHERMCLDWHEPAGTSEQSALFWLVNGGREALESYDNPKGGLPKEHLEFMRGFKPWVKRGDVVFVHAGLRPDVPLEEQNEYDLCWIRGEFFKHPEAFAHKVVFGHTPMAEIFRKGNLVGIDTGAVYENVYKGMGKLTCYEPFIDEFIQYG